MRSAPTRSTRSTSTRTWSDWRRGGFVVDMDWMDGKMDRAVIHSLAGKTCKVRYGQEALELTIDKGDSQELVFERKRSSGGSSNVRPRVGVSGHFLEVARYVVRMVRRAVWERLASGAGHVEASKRPVEPRAQFRPSSPPRGAGRAGVRG